MRGEFTYKPWFIWPKWKCPLLLIHLSHSLEFKRHKDSHNFHPLPFIHPHTHIWETPWLWFQSVLKGYMAPIDRVLLLMIALDGVIWLYSFSTTFLSVTVEKIVPWFSPSLLCCMTLVYGQHDHWSFAMNSSFERNNGHRACIPDFSHGVGTYACKSASIPSISGSQAHLDGPPFRDPVDDI